MTRIVRTSTALGVLGVGLGLLASEASALPIQFNPGAVTVSVGDAFAVDIVVSGLGPEIVSAYDLDILYDATTLAATGVTFTSLLGDELLFEVFNAFDISTPGLVDLAQLSLLWDSDLQALQTANTLTLATISFSALAVGTSALDFLFNPPFNDVKGLNAAVLEMTPTSGRVTVVAVSEPPVAWLMLLSLTLLLRRGRASLPARMKRS